ncbi:MAG: beta-lactamase family protein [Alistipes sp.]|nr:beta-lactamase family protein [Alistipes sp.]
MRQYKLLLALAMLTVGLVLTFRSCHPRQIEALVELEENLYQLNDTLQNSYSDHPQLVRMERYVRNWMARYRLRGASLSVMRGERLIYSKGLGWANEEDSIPAEAGHIFRIASASKLITAIGILKLCDEGRITTQDKVFGTKGILSDSLFSHFRDKRAANITIHHLLTHTSGFSRRQGDLMFRSADLLRWTGKDTTMTVDEVIAYQLNQRLRCNPGGSAQYSNVGYLVLSRIIEEVSGMSYEKYIQEHVLHPAGVYDMHLAKNFYHERRANEVKYYGHDPGELIEAYDGSGEMRPREYGGNNTEGLQGAGAWVCSSAELLRLMAAVDGRNEVPDILSEKSILELKKSRLKHELPYGWAKLRSNAGVYSRTGTMSGTAAFAQLNTNPDGLSFVLILNTSHYRGASFTNRLGYTVLNAFTRVKEWPEGIDLFQAVPSAEEPQTDSLAIH